RLSARFALGFDLRRLDVALALTLAGDAGAARSLASSLGGRLAATLRRGVCALTTTLAVALCSRGELAGTLAGPAAAPTRAHVALAGAVAARVGAAHALTVALGAAVELAGA